MELFEKLGIDWRLLIAQLVNFAILFGALTFFLYKPLLSLLDKRRDKIAESLLNAEKINEELARVKEESEKIISIARQKAGKIAEEAEKRAEELRLLGVEKTKNEVALIVQAGRRQLETERQEIAAAVRENAAALIVAGVEKVINQKMTSTKDAELIKKIVGDKL
jgi:F-type H+-transporting ATPase subunit b